VASTYICRTRRTRIDGGMGASLVRYTLGCNENMYTSMALQVVPSSMEVPLLVAGAPLKLA
jgi:hypothetical protein